VKRSALLALAFVVAACGLPGAAAQRLSDDVVPVSYDLTVAPNHETLRTDGSEALVVDVRRPVAAIVLNAREIDVREASIDGRRARVDVSPAVEQIALRGEGTIQRGRHRIDLTFTSTVHDGAVNGLLRGPRDVSLMTLFEPSTARTMFPCLDEPQFRARFTLHVRAPSAWTVVSNMPLRAKHDAGDGLVQNDFTPTPPMPAYMLVLDAGPFAHVEGRAASVPIRIFVRRGREAQARTMLADAERLLPFYERFFGTRFPLPKLDVVVASGMLQSAFEGWGAISFYSESMPFGQQFDGGAPGRRFAAEVLAHEMAHQWAGDLVTMRWWRDTFVSEALAQFAQREAMRSVFPQLEAWRDDDRQVADVMRRGVAVNARPVLTPIRTDLDADAFQVFAPATYEKGASAIAGWRDMIGERAFAASLHRYVRKFAYGSATFEDFWNTMGGADGVAYGHSWLAQPGYPVLDVRSSCEGGAMTITVAQTPFVTDPLIGAGYRTQRWIVPLVLHAGSVERRVLLRAGALTERLASCGRVAVEAGGGYALVRYDDRGYAAFVRDAAGLSERERSRAYRDAVTLHANGVLRDAPYLTVVAAARDPLDADVWTWIAREYARMDGLVRGAPEARVLAAMQRTKLLPFARRYGTIDSRGRRFEQLGNNAAYALAAAGDPADGALFREEYAKNASGAPAPNYSAVFVTAALAATAATAEDIAREEARTLARTDVERHNGTLEVIFLENVGDETLARRVFDDAMRDTRLAEGRPVQFLFALGSRHPDVAYAYLRAHVAELAATLPENERAKTIAMGVAESLWRAAPPDELERFLRTEVAPDDATMRAAAALIERNVRERRSLLAALRGAAHPNGAAAGSR
jgi:aminopeptidase N